MGRGLETRRTGPGGSVVDTGGGFIFVSEVPVSSTQWRLKNCGGASGAVSEGELWRFAGQMGQCVPRLRRVILAD